MAREFQLGQMPTRQEDQPYVSSDGKEVFIQAGDHTIPKEVLNSGDLEVLRDFQDQYGARLQQMNPAYSTYLAQRIAAAEKVQELSEKAQAEQGVTTPPSAPVRSAVQTGQGPEERLMLEDVHQDAFQSSANGCWAVSYGNLLRHRGVSLSQEEIRAFRPSIGKEDADKMSDRDTAFMNADSSTTPFERGDLMMKTLPNHAMKELSLSVPQGKPEKLPKFKQILASHIRGALQERSPMALRVKDHFLTVVGIQGERIFFKDSLAHPEYAADDPSYNGNPDETHSMTLDELAERTEGQPIAGIWLSEITKDPEGKIPALSSYNALSVSPEDGKVSFDGTKDKERTWLYDDAVYNGESYEVRDVLDEDPDLAANVRTKIPKNLQMDRLREMEAALQQDPTVEFLRLLQPAKKKEKEAAQERPAYVRKEKYAYYEDVDIEKVEERLLPYLEVEMNTEELDANPEYGVSVFDQSLAPAREAISGQLAALGMDAMDCYFVDGKSIKELYGPELDEKGLSGKAREDAMKARFVADALSGKRVINMIKGFDEKGVPILTCLEIAGDTTGMEDHVRAANEFAQYHKLHFQDEIKKSVAARVKAREEESQKAIETILPRQDFVRELNKTRFDYRLLDKRRYEAMGALYEDLKEGKLTEDPRLQGLLVDAVNKLNRGGSSLIPEKRGDLMKPFADMGEDLGEGFLPHGKQNRFHTRYDALIQICEIYQAAVQDSDMEEKDKKALLSAISQKARQCTNLYLRGDAKKGQERIQEDMQERMRKPRYVKGAGKGAVFFSGEEELQEICEKLGGRDRLLGNSRRYGRLDARLAAYKDAETAEQKEEERQKLSDYFEAYLVNKEEERKTTEGRSRYDLALAGLCIVNPAAARARLCYEYENRQLMEDKSARKEKDAKGGRKSFLQDSEQLTAYIRERLDGIAQNPAYGLESGLGFAKDVLGDGQIKPAQEISPAPEKEEEPPLKVPEQAETGQKQPGQEAIQTESGQKPAETEPPKPEIEQLEQEPVQEKPEAGQEKPKPIQEQTGQKPSDLEPKQAEAEQTDPEADPFPFQTGLESEDVQPARYAFTKTPAACFDAQRAWFADPIWTAKGDLGAEFQKAQKDLNRERKDLKKAGDGSALTIKDINARFELSDRKLPDGQYLSEDGMRNFQIRHDAMEDTVDFCLDALKKYGAKEHVPDSEAIQTALEQKRREARNIFLRGDKDKNAGGLEIPGEKGQKELKQILGKIVDSSMQQPAPKASLLSGKNRPEPAPDRRFTRMRDAIRDYHLAQQDPKIPEARKRELYRDMSDCIEIYVSDKLSMKRKGIAQERFCLAMAALATVNPEAFAFRQREMGRNALSIGSLEKQLGKGMPLSYAKSKEKEAKETVEWMYDQKGRQMDPAGSRGRRRKLRIVGDQDQKNKGSEKKTRSGFIK